MKQHRAHCAIYDPVPDGCDCAASGNKATNTEMLTEIMEYSRQGALMQVFILNGLDVWSRGVIARIDEMTDDSMITKAAWLACAVELKAALDKHLGK